MAVEYSRLEFEQVACDYRLEFWQLCVGWSLGRRVKTGMWALFCLCIWSYGLKCPVQILKTVACVVSLASCPRLLAVPLRKHDDMLLTITV